MRLVNKVQNNIDKICINEELFLDDAEIAILAYGVSAKSAKFAVKELRNQGVKAGLLRPLTLWPFPDDKVLEVAKRVKKIIVPEMNLGQAFFEVQRAANGNCEVDGIFKVDTEADPPHTDYGRSARQDAGYHR